MFLYLLTKSQGLLNQDVTHMTNPHRCIHYYCYVNHILWLLVSYIMPKAYLLKEFTPVVSASVIMFRLVE